MSTNVSGALARLGLEMPSPPEPAANYVPWVLAEGLVFLSGQTPKAGPVLQFKGQVGCNLTVDEGREAARLCTLRLLSALRDAVGNLDRISKIPKLTVFINSGPEFREHDVVADSASDLIAAVFGDRGLHTRSAVGSAGLPGNAAVEIEMIAQLNDHPDQK